MRIFLYIFFKRIFTLENATFRKIVPWMTTGPLSCTVFWGGERSGGGWRLCKGSFVHPPAKQDLKVHFHSFSFIHSFIQSVSQHVLKTCHIESIVLDNGPIAMNKTLFDFPLFSAGHARERCPKVLRQEFLGNVWRPFWMSQLREGATGIQQVEAKNAAKHPMIHSPSPQISTEWKLKSLTLRQTRCVRN